jgi:hypothetical protein
MNDFFTQVSQNNTRVHAVIFLIMVLFPTVMYIGARTNSNFLIWLGLIFVSGGNFFSILTR